MKALCTTVINGTRFFLTPDGFATDILKRAKTFRDGRPTAIACQRDDEHTKFCFAAARTWLNRAEYSMRNGGTLVSSDNESADSEMFQELLGDYAK